MEHGLLNAFLALFALASLQEVRTFSSSSPGGLPCTFIGDSDFRDAYKMDCSASRGVSGLVAFPTASVPAQVTEIIIEDQPLLTELPWSVFTKYTKLISLTIRKCGLKQLSGTSNVTTLQTLDLRNNKLEMVPWQLIVPLKLKKLYLEGNPLACNCSSKWLQTLLQKNASEIDRQLMCSGDDGYTYNLKSVDLSYCRKPTGSVTLLSQSKARVGDTVSASCSFSGDAPVTYQWSADKLRSAFRVTDIGAAIMITVFNLSRSDNRINLTCVGRNHVGRGDAAVAIEMNIPPAIERLGPVNDAFYKCLPFLVTGTEPLKLQWSKDGQLLDVDGTDWDAQIDSTGRDVVSGCLATTVSLLKGLFTLSVTNFFGSDSRTIFVPSSVPSSRPLSIPTYENTGAVNESYPDPEGLELLEENRKSLLFEEEIKLAGIVLGSIIGAAFLTAVLGVVFCKGRNPCFLLSWTKNQASSKRPTRRSDSARRHGAGVFRAPSIHNPNDCHENGERQPLQALPLPFCNLSENPHYQQQRAKRSGSVQQIVIEQLSFIRELGEGAFGRVYLGSCSHLTTGDDVTMVAIKTLKNTSVDSSWDDFHREAEMMADMHHNNIVTFYGTCYTQDSMLMIFEYMENGDLNKFLRSRGPDADALLGTKQPSLGGNVMSIGELLFISQQVAAGLAFLASKHFVHRDLATRNCLVGEKLIVKIGDFGMCRDVYSTDYYRVGGTPMLPIRWMPPESILYRHFTVESDIWSFGVVLWEIFTYGRQPWFELSNNEVISSILEGKLLECPLGCPPDVYKMMKGCWERQPDARTPVEHVHGLLVEALQRNSLALHNNNLNAPDNEQSSEESTDLVVQV